MMLAFVAGSAVFNLTGGMLTAWATKRWLLRDG
jgi:hypothetical protein